MPDSRKFLFDRHIFDEPEVEEEEDLPPPPPTFSEEELEAARASAYDKGRRDGLAEEKNSQNTRAAALLETLTRRLPELFSAEFAREKTYEQEAVALALAIFRTLFPALEARHGLYEAESVIRAVLNDAQGRGEIAVDLHPDAVEDIEAHLKTVAERLESVRITVRQDARLGPGDCRLSWKDGGAVRDSASLAQEITRRIEESLAGGAVNRHNETSELASGKNGES